MKTCVVAIEKRNEINNIDVLPPSYVYQGVRYIIHEDPVVQYDGLEVFKNFDFMIASRSCPNSIVTMLEEDKDYIEVGRDSKVWQQFCINRKNHPNQLRLNTYVRSTKPTDRTIPPEPDTMGKLIVKPVTGARGLGVFIIDASMVNPALVLRWISSITSAVDGASEKYPDQDPYEHLKKELDEFLAKPHIKDAVTYHCGDEDEPNEGLIAYYGQDYIVQNYVPNIESEYRLIAHTGRIQYIQKRTRTGESFKIASGAGGISKQIIQLEDMSDQYPWFDEVKKLVSTLGRDLISLDLFVTDDNQWGIFEYSNQFGVTGIPVAINKEIHRSYIAELTKHLR